MRPGSLPLWEYFFFVNTGVGWVYGTAGLTGVLLIIILAIMVLCSLSCVRRNGFFEVYSLMKLRYNTVSVYALAIGTCLFIMTYNAGILLDTQPVYSLVHFVDSPRP